MIAGAVTLSACAFMEPPPKPVAVAPPPPPPAAPSTPEPPPIPLRKPVPPPSRTQIASAIPPAPTQPEAAPPSEPPAATAPPAEAASPGVLGMNEADLAQTLGQPVARVDSPPAIIWRYVEGDCVLEIYLYQDVTTDAFHALYVDVTGDDRTDQRRQFCLQRLARRADGGQHATGSGTDPSAPR